MDSKEIVVIKEAAHRLQDFFAAKNVKVSHTMALEALTASLGSRNWRTLRDKLSEPGKAAPTMEELGGCLWTVRGTYDNGSAKFGDFVPGDTKLEAVINAVVERLSEGVDLTVAEVENRMTGKVWDNMTVSAECLMPHSEAFKLMVEHGRKMLPEFSTLPREGSAENSWYGTNAALEIFEAVLSSDKFCRQLDEFHKFLPPLGQDVDGLLGFEDSKGNFWTVPLSDVLFTLNEYLGKLKMNDHDLVAARYQVRALSEYFKDKLGRLVANQLTYG